MDLTRTSTGSAPNQTLADLIVPTHAGCSRGSAGSTRNRADVREPQSGRSPGSVDSSHGSNRSDHD